MRYLTLAEVLDLQSRVIEQSGGAFGVRDLGGVESAVAQPQMTFGGFLLVTYSWIGHQDAFPNAKLYAVPDGSVDASDRITFAYCAECESALQEWRKQDAIEP